MRQLRETRQHWRGRKRLKGKAFASQRAEHRRITKLLLAGEAVDGERPLAASWAQYSCVSLDEDWVLIYRVLEDTVLMVRVAVADEVFS